MEKVSDLTASQADQLTRWFEDLWWTRGRTRADIDRMLEHSTIVAFVDHHEKLAAFARIVSDHVFKALVLDVVVPVDRRGQGVGRRLMGAVLAHPAVSSCEHVELYCEPALVPFYERFGFTSALGPPSPVFMRRTR